MKTAARSAWRKLACRPWLIAGALTGASLGATSGLALTLPAMFLGTFGLLIGATSGSLADRVLRTVTRAPSPDRCAARHPPAVLE